MVKRTTKQKPISLHPLGFEEAVKGLLEVKPEERGMTAKAEHRHDARYIYYVTATLGYDLAQCRRCSFVAQAVLTKGDGFTSIVLKGWHKPTQKEAAALPQHRIPLKMLS